MGQVSLQSPETEWRTEIDSCVHGENEVSEHPMGASRTAAGRSAGFLSSGHLLGGRVRYAQPRSGFRSGIEPVLLASAVPASPGERVLDGGTGAAAALLCLAARVAQLNGVGIERDAALAEMARENLANNGLSEAFRIIAGDVSSCVDLGLFSHACANPPWHSMAGTASPVLGRMSAKRASPRLLTTWACSLAMRLRRGGTLTMTLPAGLTAEGCRAIESAGCGSLALIPLWPKPGRTARLVLIQAIKSAGGNCRVLPGLTLHRSDGGYSEALHAILSYAAALVI